MLIIINHQKNVKQPERDTIAHLLRTSNRVEKIFYLKRIMPHRGSSFIKMGSIKNSVPKKTTCLKSLNVTKIILFEFFQKHS